MLVSGWPVPEYFYDKSLEFPRNWADTKSMETFAVETRVRITTGLQTYGLTGTVVAVKSDPRRPSLNLRTVLLDNGSGARKDYDTRELEEI